MCSVDIRPEAGELPSSFSERLGKSYAQPSSSKDKKNKGQFFTPVSIARFMGSLGHAPNGEISILDPGCGCTVLSAALIEHLVDSGNCNSIILDVYETDTEVIPFTTAALDYLKSWLAERSISISYTLYQADFILSNSSCLDEEESLFGKQPGRKYDFIISNPPYFKLAKDDKRVKSVGKIVDGQTNIYALFLSLSACMLNEDGQMIYITPRSFASGLYFHSFRNHFFSKVAIEFIHLFNSRKGTFAKDDVLQELLIMSCRPVDSENDGSITVSFSEGSSDLDKSYRKDFPKSDIVNVESNEKVVYLAQCQESVYKNLKI